jgi:hypothetical protein
MYETELLRASTYKVTDPESGMFQVVSIPAGDKIENYFDQVFVSVINDVYIDDIKKNKINEINAAFEREVSFLMAGYPESEVMSWDKQEREARAFVADPGAPVPLISGLAAARGISISSLAQRILQKADAYTASIGAALGKRQKLEGAVIRASNKDEVLSFFW